jgi:two-component system, cell cycle response regulator
MSARVLVVDDLLPNVKLLSAKLTNEYFEVVTALNGPQALEVVRQAPPDIILLDVMMPGMDGFEVCTRIKSDPATSHIPIVMVTALSDAENRVRGLEAGADDFLTKPVNDVALFARVRALVRLKLTIDQWKLRENTSNQFGMATPLSARAEAVDHAHVLLIEDSILDRDRVATTLTRDQDTVSHAPSGAAAMQMTQAESFDLIMLSLNLEGEDSLRLCSQLRSQDKTRQTPILLMAHEDDLKRVAKGLELGATDYILRPIDRNELMARVRSQVRQKRYQDRLLVNYESNLSMALTDSLTGLYNRRYVMVHLERLLRQSQDSKKPFALMLLDIDHFKRINDSYGHPAGDDVLREFAGRIGRSLRNFDLAGRIGGEEFVAILPDTNLDVAVAVAERLRTQISGAPMTAKGVDVPIPVTTSLGVTIASDPGESVDDLIGRADRALYAAKRNGRDRVEVELAGGAEPAAAAGAGGD